MTRTKGAPRWSAVFLIVTAVLQVATSLWGGFGPEAGWLLTCAALYALCATGLIRGLRWVGYIAFVLAFIGLILTIPGIYSTAPVTAGLSITAAASHVCAIVALFVALWKSPREADA